MQNNEHIQIKKYKKQQLNLIQDIIVKIHLFNFNEHKTQMYHKANISRITQL